MASTAASNIKYNDVPVIDLPNGTKVMLILDDKFMDLFRDDPGFTPQLQRKSIRKLEAFLQEAYIKPQNTPEQQQFRLGLIDIISWQVAQCYRYSNPSRIEEAIPPLTFLVESHRKFHGGKKIDTQPALYLSVALSRVEGEEQRAIQMFNETIAHLHESPTTPTRNLIWARANMARMYRRMGRVSDAKVQERLTREWILGRPYCMPPSEIKDLLADDIGTGSYILDHPDIVRLFDSINQIGPNEAIVNYNNNIGLLQYGMKMPPGFTGFQPGSAQK